MTRIAARAKVPLAVAEDAEVVMFQTEIGDEDHFAVLIGTGSKRRSSYRKTSFAMCYRRCFRELKM